MENKVLGIHHITAIAGNAKRNFEFYTKVLGLRMVKKTVNFDDPRTYHFYYGDRVGSPGTILTFFPWDNVKQGRKGTGMATEIGYAVPNQSLDFWINRFNTYNVKVRETGKRFGEEFISFEDADGLYLNLIIPKIQDNRKAWETNDVKSHVAAKGFHSITITLSNITATAKILTDIFEFKLAAQEGNRFRYITNAVDTASIVDLLEAADQPQAINAGGTIHHVAFRVKDEATLMKFRDKIADAGYNITPKIDRNYFFSLYFREPGGVLFELATDNPGFSVDESVEELGTNLKLPSQYESNRERIESVLPELS